jgi:hypothetical protein
MERLIEGAVADVERAVERLADLLHKPFQPICLMWLSEDK